jgi:hypothetical protein
LVERKEERINQVVLPDVLVPEVELPLVVPDVLVPLVVPEVEPDVLVPDVLPEVDPSVVPEVLPDVEPLVLVELAFSEAEQALKRTSDEHRKAPVSPESSLRFIRQGKCGKEGSAGWLIGLYEHSGRDLPVIWLGKYVFPVRIFQFRMDTGAAGAAGGSQSHNTSRVGLGT